VLGRPLAAGAFDKNPAHGLGCGSKEVPPAVPGLGLFAAHQSNIRLVDQCRGLKCLTWLLMSHFFSGQPSQLVINQRQKLLGRPEVALLNRTEDAGDFVHKAHPYF